jgi:uncharacterized protein YjbI with pentapeptide repeats
MSCAQLQGASLVGAQLQGASLDYAELQGASLAAPRQAKRPEAIRASFISASRASALQTNTRFLATHSGAVHR